MRQKNKLKQVIYEANKISRQKTKYSARAVFTLYGKKAITVYSDPTYPLHYCSEGGRLRIPLAKKNIFTFYLLLFTFRNF